jgi:hypothetical protein
MRGRADDPRLRGWLDRIALEGEDPVWREWARTQVVKSGTRVRSPRAEEETVELAAVELAVTGGKRSIFSN